MRLEETSEIGHRVVLVCDTNRKGHIYTSADVTMSTRDLCNDFLYLIGWRLYRGKQLCPECAARVATRLATRPAGGAA